MLEKTPKSAAPDTGDGRETPSRDGDDRPSHSGEDESRPTEIGGRDGPDPTRYGDWEKNGRCIDF